MTTMMNVTLIGGYNGSLSDNTTLSSGIIFVNPFDVPFVRAVFIVAYSVVFICCCAGNALVLFIILKNARMRTRPYVFLANLAVADLSVGVFCVIPSLTTFLSPVWILGEAMCKVYYFVQNMSYMTSILLLTVISVERFVATMFPLKANNLFTPCRLAIAQCSIWIMACVYNIPHLVIFSVFYIPSPHGGMDQFCFLQPDIINMKLYYTFNVIMWYVAPLIIMGFMYSKISLVLWYTSSPNSSLVAARTSVITTKHSKTDEAPPEEQEKSSSTDSRSPITKVTTSVYASNRRTPFRVNSNRALKSRRRVIRLLLAIVISFSVCVLPHNVRLFLIYWDLYPMPSFLVGLFPPSAFLMLYLNSALNPFLYCLMSVSFRRKMRQSLQCCYRLENRII